MYTIELLAPILLMGCAQNFIQGQGIYCNPQPPSPQRIVFHEPGKACYIDGVFYSSCPQND